MAAWATKRMEELCEITSSKRIFAADYVSDGVPFYRAKEIGEKHHGCERVSTALFISREKFEQLQAKFGAPEPGDLLLTSIGALLGLPYVVKHGEEFYFKDGNLTWFRNCRGIDSQFLYYWMLSPQGQAELHKSKIGSAQPAFTIGLLKQMEVELPPMAEQHRIAGILLAYDELIENNQRRIKIQESMARALYREWFVHFRFPGHESVLRGPSPVGEIPEGWEVRKISEFADFTRGFEPGSNAYENEANSGRIRFLRVGDLNKRDSGLYIAEKLAEGRVLQPLDIAITLDGSVGEVRIGLDGAFSSGIRRVDVKDQTRLGWVFTYQLLLSDAAQATIKAHSKGTTIKHAGSAVAALSFVSPPKQLIDRFETAAGAMMRQVIGLQQQIENLRRTRDLLLPRLFSGQIDVDAIAS